MKPGQRNLPHPGLATTRTENEINIFLSLVCSLGSFLYSYRKYTEGEDLAGQKDLLFRSMGRRERTLVKQKASWYHQSKNKGGHPELGRRAGSRCRQTEPLEDKGETIHCLSRIETWSMPQNHVLDLRKEAQINHL